MKFRFLSGLDSPDWLLAGISLLSKVTVVKARLLTKEVVAALVQSERMQPDVPKLSKLMQDGKNIQLEDVQLVFATLQMILRGASRNNVSDATLDGELQQLGLPAEHASGICKLYAQNREEMVQAQAERFFRFGRVVNLKWHIDQYLASNSTDIVPSGSDLRRARLEAFPGANLQLCISRDPTRKTDDAVDAADRIECMYISRPMLKILVDELKLALQCMDDVIISSIE